MIEPWPSVGHVYAEVARVRGHARLDVARLNRQFREAWSRRETFDYSLSSWQAIVVDTFAGLLRGAQAEALFDDLYQHFSLADPWRIFPDALPALEAARAAGLRLGVISNWDERLRPLLDRLGLREYFEVLIISHEHGRTKPDEALFRAAAQAFGLEPALVCHVGDSHREDVLGARAAGFGAAWLCRSGEGRRREGELCCLTELAEILGAPRAAEGMDKEKF